MTLTVYTRPDCTACYYTKRWLAAHHIEYVEIVLTDADNEVLTSRGYKTLPVVITPSGVAWEGFQVDKLRTHCHDKEGAR